MLLIHLIPVALGLIAVKVQSVQAWLIEKSVLAEGDLVITFPGGGAGLDAPRLLLAVGAAGLLLLSAAAIARRRVRRRTARR